MASTTPVVFVCNGIGQGDTAVLRDGNSLKAKGMWLNWLFSANGLATFTRIRLIVFVDTRNQGANPTAADVVDTSAVGGFINSLSEPNRFFVLFDEQFGVRPASDISSVWGTVDLTPKVDGLHFTYEGSASDVTACRGPTVFVMFYSNEAANFATTSVNTRVFFVDN